MAPNPNYKLLDVMDTEIPTVCCFLHRILIFHFATDHPACGPRAVSRHEQSVMQPSITRIDHRLLSMCDSFTIYIYIYLVLFIAYPLPTHSHYLQSLLNAGVFSKLSVLISSTSDSIVKVLTLYLSLYNISLLLSSPVIVLPASWYADPGFP